MVPILEGKKGKKKYKPKDGKQIFCKKEDKREYEQMCLAVERFQTDENIKECLHSYDTQYNESLNMSVARYVPKFKHYGTTMSLESRVRCVLGVHNSGYSNFYLTLLTFLGCLGKSDDYRLLFSGIHRISNTKLKTKVFKQTAKYKRKRKHGQMARTKQQLYEEGVDRANKMGTYESGIAVLRDDEQQQQQDKRQSSNASESSKRTKTKSTNPTICSLCGLKGHKTNRSKSCKFHSQYLEKQQQNKPSESKQKNKSKNTQLVQKERTNEVSVASNVVGEVTGDELAVAEGKFAAVDASTLAISKNFALLQKALDIKLSEQNNEKNEKVKTVKKTLPETHPAPDGTELPCDVICVRNSTNNTVDVETIAFPACEAPCTNNIEHVQNIGVSTPVHEDVQIFESTAVESVGIGQKRTKNSTEDENVYGEFQVENLDFVDNEDNSNLQYDDENSNISFFTSVDSV